MHHVFNRQLEPMQDLFKEAHVQLQQELAEESGRAFKANAHDPLAILHNLHKKHAKSCRLQKLNQVIIQHDLFVV